MQIKENPNEYDVIIVGSGAGGGMATKILSEAGLSIAIVEAGPFYDPANPDQMTQMKWPYESPRRGETFVTRKRTMAAANIKLGVQDKLFLGNLDAKRDWGFAGDYVEAMWLMLQQEKPDDYVIATGETYSVKEFLDCVFDYAGLNPDKYIEIDPRLFRPQEVPYLLGNPSKAKKILNWEPKVKFEELCKMMYNEDYQSLK